VIKLHTITSHLTLIDGPEVVVVSMATTVHEPLTLPRCDIVKEPREVCFAWSRFRRQGADICVEYSVNLPVTSIGVHAKFSDLSHAHMH
jgi:hypothetical protein